jgi:hypothetical protein
VDDSGLAEFVPRHTAGAWLHDGERIVIAPLVPQGKQILREASGRVGGD